MSGEQCAKHAKCIANRNAQCNTGRYAERNARTNERTYVDTYTDTSLLTFSDAHASRGSQKGESVVGLGSHDVEGL